MKELTVSLTCLGQVSKKYKFVTTNRNDMGRGGCDKTAIVPAIICMGILYVVVAGICIFLSILLMQNEEATTAFGGETDGVTPGNLQASTTLIFIAIIMFPLAFVGAYGARAHNKFLLIGYCGAAVFLMMTIYQCGTALLHLSDVPFSDADQSRCLANVRKDVDDALCKEYFIHEKVKYLRQLWFKLHVIASNQSHPASKVWNTFFIKLQKGDIVGGTCCGFQRPNHCVGLSGETCDMTIQENPDEVFYKETEICMQGLGGCRFDLPLGICACRLLIFARSSSVSAYTLFFSIPLTLDYCFSIFNYNHNLIR